MMQSSISREMIKEYKELLLKWNKTINLISKKDIDKIQERHFEDSMQLIKFIPNTDISMIDIGSGAGFPGIILSMMGVNEITLIESDSRKVAFLIQAIKLSSNIMRVINDRVENVEDLVCDIITSRAFADLSAIFNYTQNITVKDKYLLHKDESYQKELDEAAKHWLFNVNIHDSIIFNKGKILEITDVRARYS
ncbi:MAG: 16S rRNA (guanine(527)-N(7))-methyltransferase RsmG [Rickettsiales bacterium]|nr:MAG: 16S rRNA (guanine(527)-N(7))-methyltransferase RsmG [Rickettsiales bacterium]